MTGRWASIAPLAVLVIVMLAGWTMWVTSQVALPGATHSEVSFSEDSHGPECPFKDDDSGEVAR